MSDDVNPTTPGWYQDDSGRRHWWDGAEFNDDAAPGRENAIGDVPGLTAAVISAFLAFLSSPFAILSVPLGILAIFQSARALRYLPFGMPGRRVVLAARAVAVVAISIGLLIALYMWSRTAAN